MKKASAAITTVFRFFPGRLCTSAMTGSRAAAEPAPSQERSNVSWPFCPAPASPGAVEPAGEPYPRPSSCGRITACPSTPRATIANHEPYHRQCQIHGRRMRSPQVLAQTVDQQCQHQQRQPCFPGIEGHMSLGGNQPGTPDPCPGSKDDEHEKQNDSHGTGPPIGRACDGFFRLRVTA